MSAETDTITVGDPMPRIAVITHVRDHIAFVTWGKGLRAGLTEERLAADVMSNAEFRDFLDRHHLTLEAVGAVLGLSRRQVAYYANDRPVPRLVALACAGYDARHNDQRAA